MVSIINIEKLKGKLLSLIEDELCCELYFFDECSNSFCINPNLVYNEQKMYKELISITNLLEKFNIDYEVDIDNTISLI